jgi:predicted permease
VTRAASRYVVARRLRRIMPPDALSGALGDLDEEFITRIRTMGRLRAEWWMLREAQSIAQAYRRNRFHDDRSRFAGARDLRAGLAEGIRHIRRAPGYTLLAVGSLGLAVAAMVSTAGVTTTILNQSVARSEADQVHRLVSTTTAGQSRAFSFPELDAIDAAVDGTATLGAVALTPALIRVDTSSTQDLIDVSLGALHDVLGLPALRGRLLTRDDDVPGRPRVLVASEGFWRTHLGASDDALGRVVAINGLDYTLVGVAPTTPSLGFFGVSAAGWVPAATADSLLTRGWRSTPDARAFIALVKSGTSGPQPQLNGQLTTVATNLARLWPDRWRERQLRLDDGLLVTGDLRRMSVLIAAVLSTLAALLLVVSATNVGGLVFAQASTRRRAMAVKAALGARPGTLVAGTLAEGALLGAMSGIAALILYGWFTQVAQSIDVLPTITLRIDLPWNIEVAGLTMCAGIAAGLATTLLPALSASRMASTRSDGLSLRQSGDATAGGARRWLLAAQVAAAIVLVMGATLFTRSLDAVGDATVGLDVEHLAAFDFDIEPVGVAAEDLPSLARTALERVRELPGVAAAAMASRAPVDQSTPSGDVRAVANSRDVVLRDVTRLEVTPGYFDTVGLVGLSGRLFSSADVSRPVAVINETMARRLDGATTFTDLTSGTAFEVVGVVADAKYRTLTELSQPHYYSPTEPQFHLALLVRAHGDPAALFEPVQRALDTTGPGVQGFFPRTGLDQLRPVLFPTIVSAGVARALGLLAGALATLGLFGLLSWLVQSRRHEWGLRIALGASPGDLRRLVLSHAWRAAWPGALTGLALATLAAWLARGQIVGLTLLDPVVLLVVPTTIVSVVLVASWLPGRRAGRTSATELLR